MRTDISVHMDTPLCTPMHFSKSHVVELSGAVIKPVEKHGGGWRTATMRGRQRQWKIRWRTQSGRYRSEPPVMPHTVSEILSFDDRDWHVEYLLPTDDQWTDPAGVWWALGQQPIAFYRPHPHIDILPGRVSGDPTLMDGRLSVPYAAGAFQRFANEGVPFARAAEKVCDRYAIPDPQHVLSAVSYAGSRHHLSLERGKYQFRSYRSTCDCGGLYGQPETRG